MMYEHHSLRVALKRTTPIIERRGFVQFRVWLDDLDSVVKLIQEVAPDVRLRADDYELESIWDLSDLPQSYIERFEANAT